MSRPKLDANEKRSETMCFRMTTEEKRALEKKCRENRTMPSVVIRNGVMAWMKRN